VTVIYIYIYIYIERERERGVLCMYICIYMVIPLSSPYLVVVGDDCVFGTREQMMLLQVVLVRLSYGAGIAWECYILCFQK